jgi:hypothetical protein
MPSRRYSAQSASFPSEFGANAKPFGTKPGTSLWFGIIRKRFRIAKQLGHSRHTFLPQV